MATLNTISKPTNWSDYYKRVLDNPTATEESKKEARRKLGISEGSAMSEEIANRANLGDAGPKGVNGVAGAETPIDTSGEEAKNALVKQLSSAMETAKGTTSLVEEKKRLETEAGLPALKESVGSYQEEISKTQTLLDSLEENIKKRTGEYLVSEPQRERIYASEQSPLLKSLNILQRGETAATGKLETARADILTELGLIEKQRTEPLEMLQKEVDIRSKIKDLTEMEMPNVVTSEFNDAGDLTIVTQNPDTRELDTQTIPGVGKKAEKYTQFETQTNDAGDTTIIGITKDGIPEVIATYKGVGKGGGTGTATGELSETAAGILTNVNELLSADLGAVARIANRSTAGKLNQVVQQLAVNARSMIKGQGQISDKETEMLQNSVTTLQTKGLGQEAVKAELRKISGILRSNSGNNVEVQVMSNGEVVDEGLLGRDDIYDALTKGYQVVYK